MTTAMTFATQQKTVSRCFAVSVTWNGCGTFVKTWILFITEIIDHTAEAMNIMIGEVCDSSSRNDNTVGLHPAGHVNSSEGHS